MKSQPEVLWAAHPGPQQEFTDRLEDIVLYGGTKGPGKSDALLMEGTRQLNHPRYKAIIIRRNFTRLNDLIDRSKAIFPKLGGKWQGDLKRWIFPSGATYGFGHCEHEDDKYNYQGQEFTYIGIDQVEELTESMVNFILAQNRTSAEGLRCYARLTANPGGPGQAWVRRWFIYELDENGKKVGKKKPCETYTKEFKIPDGRRITRTSCFVPGTIYDNPTLLKNNPTYLANLSSLPEAERLAFLDGDWEAFLSQCVFDRQGMVVLSEMVEEPRITGLLRDAGHTPELVIDEKGPLKVWRTPKTGKGYFIFADVAKGVEGGDYSDAQVYDRSSWEQVAEWHGKVDSLEFGKILYGLGLYYNTAIIAVEVWPGPGISTGQKLVEMKYPNLYKNTEWDGEANVKTGEVGWVTNKRTRWDMLATLKESVREKGFILRSQEALDEFENFIRHENGKEAAREGCFDDRVITAAGALHCMKFMPYSEQYGQRNLAAAPLVVTSLVRGNRSETRRGKHWRQYERTAANV